MQPGNYSLTVGVHYSSGETIDYLDNIYDFQVLTMGGAGMPDYPTQLVHGWVGVDSKWEKAL